MADIFFLPNLTKKQLDEQQYSLRESDPHFFDLIAPTRLALFRNKHDKAELKVLGRDKLLDGVTAADRFYVFGHGDYRTGSLYTKAPDGTTVQMYGLATLLFQRKLPDLLGLTVRLFACTSGVTDGSGEKSMAQKLAINLGLLKYERLKVKGYTGFVNLGDGKNLHVTKEYNETTHALGKLLLAKDNYVSYDMQGRLVSGQEAVGHHKTTAWGKQSKFRIAGR